jgi:hypothetical protein
MVHGTLSTDVLQKSVYTWIYVLYVFYSTVCLYTYLGLNIWNWISLDVSLNEQDSAATSLAYFGGIHGIL